MRAAHITQYGSPDEALEIATVDTPEPGPEEVRIQVEACALNRLDVFARLGHPEDEGDFPRRTGCDISGVVDSVGPDVTGVEEGESVIVYPGVTCGECEFCLNGEHTMCPEYRIIGEDLPGGLAEYLTVPAWNVEPKPDELDFVSAAAWPITFTTAWRMLVTTGGLRPAESALVLGASGGVGNAALQIAERIGATAYATTSSDEKAARLEEWADAVIDYTEAPFDEAVRDLTDGRGVDLVADHVGQETWQTSIDALAMGGRMVICGATSGPDPDIDIRSVYQRHRQILGAPMGNRQDFRDALKWVARGEVEPVIDRVLPLDDIADGHRLIEDREVFGKVVVRPNE
ncbi:zinc-binding dehydrogenase (plasmid) [Halorussus salilacus]|uniref:zinc-binding dehydrogenase n=1 Tax=Halorussus salilacus TaxID=2953750 RepID=UPI00209D6385|nr:zinc-binding dehydrogenase [Halorussus salilacus]USZ70185.1 zinc-binding dehydrogenase [Halorussus salilacus]